MRIDEDDYLIHDPRRAGTVKRFHALPHLAEQSVGEHTWQLLRIMTTIWTDLPRSLLIYTIYHDIAEGCTGDLPYTTKTLCPEIKSAMDDYEDQVTKRIRQLWGIPILPCLTDEERMFMKACELLEMVEYAWHELRLGNKYASAVVRRIMPRVKDVKFENTYLNTRFHQYVRDRLDYEGKKS